MLAPEAFFFRATDCQILQHKRIACLVPYSLTPFNYTCTHTEVYYVCLVFKVFCLLFVVCWPGHFVFEKVHIIKWHKYFFFIYIFRWSETKSQNHVWILCNCQDWRECVIFERKLPCVFVSICQIYVSGMFSKVLLDLQHSSSLMPLVSSFEQRMLTRTQYCLLTYHHFHNVILLMWFFLL